MKPILYLLLFLILSAITKSDAQNYTLVPGDTFVINQGLNDLQYDGIEWTNNTNQTMILSWKRIELDTIPGSMMDFCASGECFIGLPDTGSSHCFPTAPGQNGWFKFHYWSGSTAGTSKARIYIYEATNPNNGDTLTYIFNMNSLNTITENSKELISFYPNPVVDVIKFNIKNNQINYKVSVINAVGQSVKEIEISYSDNSLDLSTLKKGVYFITIRDNQNKIIQKNKIIKN